MPLNQTKNKIGGLDVRKTKVLRKTKSLSRKKKAKSRRKNIPKKSGRNIQSQKKRKRATRARLYAKPKRTFQLTKDLAKEVFKTKFTKGRTLRLTAENAEKVLIETLKKARRVFSRKKSSRWAIYLYLKWKHETGSYRVRTVVRVAPTPEKAILALVSGLVTGLLNELPASADQMTEEKIVGARIDKYVERKRKISKTTRKNKTRKKSRRIRHRSK